MRLNKKGQGMGMVQIAIGAILAVVILGATFTFLTTTSTELQNIQNETITISSRAGQTANVDLQSVSFLGNGTFGTDIDGITVGSEVNFTTQGVISVAGDNFTDADYFISYIHEPTGYISDGNTRTIIRLVPVLLAIMLLIFVVGFMALKK